MALSSPKMDYNLPAEIWCDILYSEQSRPSSFRFFARAGTGSECECPSKEGVTGLRWRGGGAMMMKWERKKDRGEREGSKEGRNERNNFLMRFPFREWQGWTWQTGRKVQAAQCPNQHLCLIEFMMHDGGLMHQRSSRNLIFHHFWAK